MSTRPSRRRIAILGAASVAALALAGCGGGAAGGGGSAKGAPLTLTVEGPGETQTDNMNPLVPTSAINTLGISTFIYEPLLQFNQVRPNVEYPWLATSYQWSNGDRTLTFHLRPHVKWSDGKPFTSADVVFTFDLLKRQPATNTNGITFSSVKARGPDEVVLTFPKPSFAQFYYVAGLTDILPEHIWSGISNPTKALNKHPVGTGPMVLKSFSPENLVLAKNTRYWQADKVKVAQMDFPTASVSTDITMLSQGRMDWAAGAFPNLKKTFVAKSRDNHYWFPATGVVTLVPNLTVWPLGDLAVRKAISLAVNRSAVSVEGESGYEAPEKTATGLVMPNDASLLAGRYKHLRLTQNLSRAKALLRSAGFSWGHGGVLQKGGRKVSLTLVDPSDFPDYMTDDQIMAGELRKLGIKARVSGVSVQAWTGDLASGRFDLSTDYSNSAPSPYVIYDGWLDSSLTKPIGKTASGDWERWKDPATQALLHAYQTATDDAGRTRAIQGLEGIVAKDMPVIPLVGSADWGEYRTAKVVGWPSPSHPYDAASSYPPGNEVVLVHLRPRG